MTLVARRALLVEGWDRHVCLLPRATSDQPRASLC